MPIRVLIVDDSALVRSLLTEMLSEDPQVEVVGTAADPYIAREKIKKLRPDVLTLDIEMPRMDGITFLKNLMRLRPMPVIMVSTLTDKGAAVTMEALRIGAFDFIAKPKMDLVNTLTTYQNELLRKVKAAAKARVNILGELPSKRAPVPHQNLGIKLGGKLIAIGASAGGTEALKQVLQDMPADAPGIVITLHIPPVFSASFANRMDEVSKMTVSEAQDGDRICQGHVYVAPGNRHLEVERGGAGFCCKLSDGAVVMRHKPSVDVLFRSVAKNVGKRCVAGAILTGMGKDGSAALGEIRRTGVPTIAQDESTSVVWGMPGEAVSLGSVDEILPLGKIAGRLAHFAKNPKA